MRRAMTDHPLDIAIRGKGARIGSMHALLNGSTGGCLQPLMQFRMAVRKSQRIRMVMITAGQITSPLDRGGGINNQPAVVDAVRMLVREDPKIHGRRTDDVLSLIHISEPTRLGMISYAVFCLKKK